MMKFQILSQNCILDTYEGNETTLEIPDIYMGYPVSAIGAKAFLSCKNIWELTLSENIIEINSWAFAHMKNLTRLTLPINSITFGKDVFLDCPRLTEIHIAKDTSKNPGLPFLMASAVTIINNISLCNPEMAGNNKTHSQWLKDYDKALTDFLVAHDETGFEPVFLGWFTVEDFDPQRERFVSKRREEKTFLAFQRLIYCQNLSDDTKQLLFDYLTCHMPGGTLEQEHTIPFTMLCQVYMNDIRYLKVIAETGYITKNTIGTLLEGLKNAGGEVLGFLLDYQQRFLKCDDFFEMLTL